MLSYAGLSAGVEPGEGEVLNGEANESGSKGGENKRKKREKTKRAEAKRYKKGICFLDLDNKYSDSRNLRL